jgi:hypothetical protein
METGSTTWLSTPCFSNSRWTEEPSSPAAWIATSFTDAQPGFGPS